MLSIFHCSVSHTLKTHNCNNRNGDTTKNVEVFRNQWRNYATTHFGKEKTAFREDINSCATLSAGKILGLLHRTVLISGFSCYEQPDADTCVQGNGIRMDQSALDTAHYIILFIITLKSTRREES